MRGFSPTEFEERLRKARLLMQEKKFEMLLITSPHNFRYFTGFDSYFWESPTRPWFLLLSLNQDPIAIVPSIGETAIQKTWIQNIKTWQSPNPNDEGLQYFKIRFYLYNQINVQLDVKWEWKVICVCLLMIFKN